MHQTKVDLWTFIDKKTFITAAKYNLTKNT